MSRKLSLPAIAGILVFGLLAVGLVVAPDADPARLAAAQVGELVREAGVVTASPEDSGTTGLLPGDIVLDGDGEERVIARIEGDQAWLEAEGSEESVPTSSLSLHTGGPLWRMLTSAPVAETGEDGSVEVRLKGSRMTVEGGVLEDPVLHEYARQSVVRALRSVASEKSFPIEVIYKPSRDFDGATILATLGAESLTLEILDPAGQGRSATIDYAPPTSSSLLPPLLAIALAILFRKPVLALSAGVLVGAFLVRSGSGESAAAAAYHGVLDFGAKYFWSELTDTFRIEIILFVVFMLAMVGVMTRAGGIQGLMDRLAGLASDMRRTQIATWVMGLAVFFDDYANTILVGSTMRPLSDRFRVAREKLAYIVDSTAAPVAGISIFSTWIAFEVSTFSAQLPDAGLAPSDGYSVFMQTLPYRFYCLLTLFMVGLLVFTGRSFGPMLKAEERALGGELLRKGATPMVSKESTELVPAPGVRPRARVALMPLAVFVIGTMAWIIWTGAQGLSSDVNWLDYRVWTEVLGAGGGSAPLMYGALAGLTLASLLAFMEGLRLEILRSAWSSIRSMGIAIVILFLAWMIGSVCGDLGTATYLAVEAREGLPAIALPLLLFVLSSAVAFSTGSSWSTMTILLPIVVGLAFNLGEGTDIGGLALVVMSIGAVLEGSIFGDHCSPISDTTVMSSIASASDHIDHVRTQAPYAILTMTVALVFGYFPAAFFASPERPWMPFACLFAGALALTMVVLLKGRRPVAPGAADIG